MTEPYLPPPFYLTHFKEIRAHKRPPPVCQWEFAHLNSNGARSTCLMAKTNRHLISTNRHLFSTNSEFVLCKSLVRTTTSPLPPPLPTRKRRLSPLKAVLNLLLLAIMLHFVRYACSSRNFLASIAALQPLAAAVIA